MHGSLAHVRSMFQSSSGGGPFPLTHREHGVYSGSDDSIRLGRGQYRFDDGPNNANANSTSLGREALRSVGDDGVRYRPSPLSLTAPLAPPPPPPSSSLSALGTINDRRRLSFVRSATTIVSPSPSTSSSVPPRGGGGGGSVSLSPAGEASALTTSETVNSAQLRALFSACDTMRQVDRVACDNYNDDDNDGVGTKGSAAASVGLTSAALSYTGGELDSTAVNADANATMTTGRTTIPLPTARTRRRSHRRRADGAAVGSSPLTLPAPASTGAAVVVVEQHQQQQQQ